MTIDGYKDIDKIHIGDRVLSYNEMIEKNEYQKVTNVFVFKDKDEELYTMTIDGKFISATGYHRFYIKNGKKYSYVPANELKIGDVVRYSDGSYHIIDNIIHSPIKKTVYNLEVDNNHNFYVGNGVLVHNATRPINRPYLIVHQNNDALK